MAECVKQQPSLRNKRRSEHYNAVDFTSKEAVGDKEAEKKGQPKKKLYNLILKPFLWVKGDIPRKSHSLDSNSVNGKGYDINDIPRKIYGPTKSSSSGKDYARKISAFGKGYSTKSSVYVNNGYDIYDIPWKNQSLGGRSNSCDSWGKEEDIESPATNPFKATVTKPTMPKAGPHPEGGIKKKKNIFKRFKNLMSLVRTGQIAITEKEHRTV